MTPGPVQRITLKLPGGTDITARKSSIPQPVSPRLDPWRHDPHLRHTHVAAVAQLIIQEHLNHIYHQVTGQYENCNKLKLRHPKLWTNSMSNELG